MARNAASYFRSATMFAVSLLMVQVHVSTESVDCTLYLHVSCSAVIIMLLTCHVRIVLNAGGFSLDTIFRYDDFYS